MSTAPNTIKHILTGLEFTQKEIFQLISLARRCKNNPHAFDNYLQGKALIMLFEKPSLRTRLSFTRAVQLLGGDVIESIGQTRKHEEPHDLMRVINGFGDAVMIRAHDDNMLVDMAKVAKIPIINGLTALHHPCQIFADLCLLAEVFGGETNITLSYVGDGNNVLHSLMLLAPMFNVKIHYCCPLNHGPNAKIIKLANELYADNIKSFNLPNEAVASADVVYTDVWQSMGFDKIDASKFLGFQINEELMSLAAPHAILMHCMPMERGKEVSKTLPDAVCSKIFMQSEYRLYAQMALLMMTI